jgi:hypothetical protein
MRVGDSHSPIKSVYKLSLKSGGIKQLRKAEEGQKKRREDPQHRKGQKERGKPPH